MRRAKVLRSSGLCVAIIDIRRSERHCSALLAELLSEVLFEIFARWGLPSSLPSLVHTRNYKPLRTASFAMIQIIFIRFSSAIYATL